MSASVAQSTFDCVQLTVSSVVFRFQKPVFQNNSWYRILIPNG